MPDPIVKPCPRCGGMPEIDTGLIGAEYPPGEELVICPTVFVAVPGSPDQSCGTHAIGLAAWNRRAPIPVADALARLRVAILAAIPDAEWCVNLSAISAETGIDREICRAVIAGLRKDGHVEYHRGLFSEDGMPAGSGYSLTLAGADHLRREADAP